MELSHFPAAAFYCLSQPTNHMNSSLTSLYRKGHPESSSCSPRREQSAARSSTDIASPASSAGTLVSTGGWFIDRGKHPEKLNVEVLDLCDEEPTNAASNVEVF